MTHATQSLPLSAKRRLDITGQQAFEDRTMAMLAAMAAELAVTRERLDTVERLLEASGAVSREQIENYTPDAASARERGEATRAYVARIMRGFQQEVEAMQNPDPPLMDIVDQLSQR
jgi:hypothetical protein